MHRSISFPEHGSLDVRLSAVEAEAVRESRLRLEVTKLGQSTYRLKAGRWVGTEVVQGLLLQVVPKLPADRLLHILAMGDVPIDLGPSGALGAAGETVGVLQRLFSSALRRALSRGLLRDYQERVDELDAVRGTIDFEDLATRRFGIFPPVPCRFDEHTHDIEPNRRLRAAAWLLSQIPGDPSAARALGAQARDLAGVVSVARFSGALIPCDLGALPQRQLGAGAADYLAALRLAELALRHARPSFKGSDVAAPSFVVNMDKAFELFLSRGLQRELGIRARWWRDQAQAWLDEERTVKLLPDIVWREGRSTRLVIDAKWKQTPKALSADIRQVVLYCHALGADRGAIVYGDVGAGRDLKIVRSGVRIRTVSLPLSGSVIELQRSVRALAEELREFSRRSPVAAPVRSATAR